MIACILTDIEGTTTPITFVHEVLFPFSKRYLARFVDDAATRAQMAQWIEQDRKEPALKALQGRIWREGYESGELVSEVYDDVPQQLVAWQKRGLRLAVYSSGSVEAQKLLFKYTRHGDMTKHFEAYFDTAVGAKREAESYRRIASALALKAGQIAFLSDVTAELDAAKDTGMRTVQLVRPGITAGTTHETAADFHEVDRLISP